MTPGVRKLMYVPWKPGMCGYGLEQRAEQQ